MLQAGGALQSYLGSSGRLQCGQQGKVEQLGSITQGLWTASSSSPRLNVC